ncbi:MAG: hypothetical protein IPI98_00400 [Chitinophagaceae bacterium]|nr:hypothetical protein [Chitinophagaceae bacterium]
MPWVYACIQKDTPSYRLQRLVNYQNGSSDPQLPVLHFNFGRYLLISSSRRVYCLQPAGLWATEYQTPMERRLSPQRKCTNELLAGRAN